MLNVKSFLFGIFGNFSFEDIESCLDEMKTKLAAAITKIRIEKQALSLQFLLPIHLRNEKVAKAVTNPIITGWVNKLMNV